MSWYRGTQWVSKPGTELAEVMAKTFPTGPEILNLLRAIKREGYNPIGISFASIAWVEVLRKLTQDGELFVLVEHVITVKPALATRIRELGDDPGHVGPQAVSAPSADPYRVLLIGPGKLPMVDRDNLRGEFRRFLESPFPALLVVGADRSGKSHSQELFRHVVGGLDDTYELKQIDFSSVSSGNDGTALLSLLCRRLGLEDVTERVSRTTTTRHAVDLVDDLVGVYRAPERKQRVVVVDGLNRKNLEPDVHKVAAKLVKEVVQGNLPGTQLVLAGYIGALDPQIRLQVLKEATNPITRTHVRVFFQTLGKEAGRSLPKKQIDELVTAVMAGKPPLDVVAERVRAEALKLQGAT